MQEVSWIHLVDRNVPERRDVEVAKVFLLAIGRPAAVDVGQVVVRAARFAFERTGRPHARKRPPVEIRRGCHDDRLRVRQRNQILGAQEFFELTNLRLGHRDELAGRRVLLLRPTPRLDRVTTVQTTRNLPELLLNGRQLPQRDREEPIRADIDTVLELEFLLEAFAAQAERRLRPRRQVGLEVIEIRLDRRRGLGRCVREVAKNVKVVETGERARQIRLDEAQRAAPAFETDFDEDPRTLS